MFLLCLRTIKIRRALSEGLWKASKRIIDPGFIENIERSQAGKICKKDLTWI